MPLLPYAKPYLSLSQQMELLRARGMYMDDEAKAINCLHRIGYYRLSGYWFPFRHQEIRSNIDGSESKFTSEQFRPGSAFSDVMALYVFDKKLRLLVLDAIERIEVALRVDVALLLGKLGALSHYDATHFNAYFSSLRHDRESTPHEDFLVKLETAIARSNEDFVTSFRAKYTGPMPIWMCIELWDFGTLSTVLSGMQDRNLQRLADRYELPRRKLLVSWAQSINFVRNVCAHHGRLWNRPPVQQPGPMRLGESALLDHLAEDEKGQRRLYAVVASLQYLLQQIHPDSTWAQRLKAHVDTFPSSSVVSVAQMGFPADWEALELWDKQLEIPPQRPQMILGGPSERGDE